MKFCTSCSFLFYPFSETFLENGLSVAVVVVIFVIVGAAVIAIVAGIIYFYVRCRRGRPFSRNSRAGNTSESRPQYDPVRQTVDMNI